MPLPVWMLVGFAAWTILLLIATVGIYRFSRILTGHARISSFRADQVEGSDWYRRATRAHANCVENLPVFGAIVLALHVSAAGGAVADYASIGVLIARVMQSLVHVCFVQTDLVASIRFVFFSVQIVAFLWLLGILLSGLIFGA